MDLPYIFHMFPIQRKPWEVSGSFRGAQALESARHGFRGLEYRGSRSAEKNCAKGQG